MQCFGYMHYAVAARLYRTIAAAVLEFYEMSQNRNFTTAALLAPWNSNERSSVRRKKDEQLEQTGRQSLTVMT